MKLSLYLDVEFGPCYNMREDYQFQMVKELPTSKSAAQVNWIRALSTTFCALCAFVRVFHPGTHHPAPYLALMLAIFWNCMALSTWPGILDPHLRRYLALSVKERKCPEVYKPATYWISTAYGIAALVLPLLVLMWHFRHYRF